MEKVKSRRDCIPHGLSMSMSSEASQRLTRCLSFARLHVLDYRRRKKELLRYVWHDADQYKRVGLVRFGHSQGIEAQSARSLKATWYMMERIDRPEASR